MAVCEAFPHSTAKKPPLRAFLCSGNIVSVCKSNRRAFSLFFSQPIQLRYQRSFQSAVNKSVHYVGSGMYKFNSGKWHHQHQRFSWSVIRLTLCLRSVNLRVEEEKFPTFRIQSRAPSRHQIKAHLCGKCQCWAVLNQMIKAWNIFEIFNPRFVFLAKVFWSKHHRNNSTIEAFISL